MTIQKIINTVEKLNDIIERIRLQYHDDIAEIVLNDEEIEAIKAAIRGLQFIPIPITTKKEDIVSCYKIGDSLHKIAERLKEG